MRKLITGLLLLCALPLAAGTFRPSDGTTSSASSRYRVSLSDTGVEPVSEIAARLAATYGGSLEPYAAEGFHGFVIVLTPQRARMMSGDDEVADVEELPFTTAGGQTAVPPPSAAAVAKRPQMRTNATGDWSRTYSYDGSGNITAAGTDSFRYDLLSRVTTGTVNGLTQSYDYDAFGNLKQIGAVSSNCAGGTACGAGSIDVDSATNHLPLATYDDAGNLTLLDATHRYAWDATGMMTSSADGPTASAVSRQYIYSASDERIATYIAGRWNWSVRDLSGAVLREFTSVDAAGATPGAGTLTWAEDYVYRGTQLLASETPVGRRHFHLDHLGTPRVITDDAGRELGRHDYLPFGAELESARREAPEDLHKFTGHERDADGSVYTLDYMHARYYGAQWGRFLSMDPVAGDPSHPQAWNRYAYVENNPIKRVDPDGRCSVGMALLLGPGCLVVDVVRLGIDRGGQAIEAAKGMGTSASVEENLEGAAVITLAVADVAANTIEPEESAIEQGTAQIIKNAAVGRAGEAAVKDELIQEGKTILGSQVSAKTSQGRRVIDHLVQDGNGVHAVEVKTGGATRTPSQVAKDKAMATQGAKLVGKNAPPSLKDQVIKIVTEVRRWIP